LFELSKEVKNTTQEDLDMIRIKIEDMDSTEDKTFLMEKLYKHIRAIDEELRRYRDTSPASADERERCEELKQMKADAQDLRRRILDFQLPSDHYGLFVRYPKGYEG
jgi:primosomal protein N''